VRWDAFLSFQVCRGDSKALEPSHRPVEVTSEACNSISVLLSLSGSRWLEYVPKVSQHANTIMANRPVIGHGNQKIHPSSVS